MAFVRTNSKCLDARPVACNFDSNATDNDGSCNYAEPFYDCDGNCLNDADSDGVCDELEVLGCDDPVACNFNSSATDNDGSCTYAEPFYDCDGNCLNDADSDGVCDELETWMRRPRGMQLRQQRNGQRQVVHLRRRRSTTATAIASTTPTAMAFVTNSKCLDATTP